MKIRARTEQLIVKEIDGEVVVYDEREHRAHELNATAACVWRNCVEETSLEDLAEALARDTELPADQGIVRMAVVQLSRAGLVELDGPAMLEPLSRRQVISRLGLGGSLAVALPVVVTLVAPTPAMARSIRPIDPGDPGREPIAPIGRDR